MNRVPKSLRLLLAGVFLAALSSLIGRPPVAGGALACAAAVLNSSAYRSSFCRIASSDIVPRSRST